jgi:hypothetical protein
MAIGIVFTGEGVTQAQYEQARDIVSPDNRLAPGMLSHVGGPTQNGWCVVETWESQEAAQAFFEQKLGQALQVAGINVQPTFFQVYNTMQ